ncbi:branched-chain amino acid aminotransferase [Propionimicrobium lymphophilum]|uniref:branched-chain amino acid aminotransferase n=1 Tax=Propionimicrobium lymphophilum TaxID=33012 RepID=UPI003EC71930
MSLKFELPENPSFLADDAIATIHENPGFGKFFTDHMAVADWNHEDGWKNDRLVPYSPVAMDPAGAVYHYAQEVFEGMKAYRHADGSVWLFRPERNAARMADSAKRLALPALPVEDYLKAVENLVKLDERWVPGGEEQSLYIRPFEMANEDFLGVRPAETVVFVVICSPVGAYFSGGVHAVDIWVESQYARVAVGGTGSAKCGGNYAASLLPQKLAEKKGCSQVLFLDAAEHRWLEELGGMNICLITNNDELVTPELNGNILPGVTRDSLLQLAPDLGLTPVGRPVSYEEVLNGIESGAFVEAFACGTAAVITPIASLQDADGVYAFKGEPKKSLELRNHLIDIQYGRVEDTRGWMHRVV